MEWCRLYARLPRDTKILQAGEAAAWLFVVGMCHCAEQETDGFIAEGALKTFGLRRVSARVDALVATGLWQETDGGWLVANWLPLQESKEKMQAKRHATRERVARHRERKVSGNGVTNALVTRLEVEVEEEVEKKNQDHSKNGLARSSSNGVTRGSRLPDDFAVTDEMKDWVRQHTPNVDGWKETEKFIDYWRAQPGAKGRKTDWLATWRNWMRRASEQAPRGNGNGVAIRETTPDAPGTPAHFQRAMARALEKEADQ